MIVGTDLRLQRQQVHPACTDKLHRKIESGSQEINVGSRIEKVTLGTFKFPILQIRGAGG